MHSLVNSAIYSRASYKRRQKIRLSLAGGVLQYSSDWSRYKAGWTQYKSVRLSMKRGRKHGSVIRRRPRGYSVLAANIRS